jgi:hypothetical protein
MKKNGLYVLLLSLTFLSFTGCKKKNPVNKDKTLALTAISDASVGGLFLNIYKDSSFDFTAQSMLHTNSFQGKIEWKNDTIYFIYENKIPDIGTKAIFTPNTIAFVEGTHPESLLIRFNQFEK